MSCHPNTTVRPKAALRCSFLKAAIGPGSAARSFPHAATGAKCSKIGYAVPVCDASGHSPGRPHDWGQFRETPFPGQPLQGFSGIRSLGEGRYLVLTDNGFGAKNNSSDVILMFNIVKPDWDSGRVAIEKTVQLSDPDQKVPFPIMNEAAPGRFLTGAAIWSPSSRSATAIGSVTNLALG